MPKVRGEQAQEAGGALQTAGALSVAKVATTSMDAFVSVLFGPSRKASFPEALEFCERAAIFETGAIQGQRQYHATFAKSLEQVAVAHGAMRALQGQAGLRIFLGGSEYKGYSVSFFQVLDCYVKSCQCVDYRAHCHQIVRIDRAEDDLESDSFLLPCRYLKTHAYHLEARHPASLKDQVQALAVSAGCNWCPRFNMGAFRSIDSDVIDI